MHAFGCNIALPPPHFPPFASIPGIVTGHVALGGGRKAGNTRKAFACMALAYVAAALTISLSSFLAYALSDGLR